MKNRAQAGFSLLELIISLSLSTVVLIGVIAMATQVVRNSYGTIKTGEVSALTLTALDAMNRELEKATYLAPGSPGVAGGNVISACMNYASILVGTNINGGSGQVDPNEPVRGFYYCIRNEATPGQFDSLIRYPPMGTYGACPIVPGGGCGVAGTFDVVVLKNVSLMDNPAGGTYASYFYRDNTVGGVDVRFIVGNSTPAVSAAAGTVAMPTPVAYKFATQITMSKSYQTGTGD